MAKITCTAGKPTRVSLSFSPQHTTVVVSLWNVSPLFWIDCSPSSSLDAELQEISFKYQVITWFDTVGRSLQKSWKPGEHQKTIKVAPPSLDKQCNDHQMPAKTYTSRQREDRLFPGPLETRTCHVPTVWVSGTITVWGWFSYRRKIRSPGSIYKAGAVVKTVTFDAIVSARAGGAAEVWKHARHLPTQSCL